MLIKCGIMLLLIWLQMFLIVCLLMFFLLVIRMLQVEVLMIFISVLGCVLVLMVFMWQLKVLLEMVIFCDRFRCWVYFVFSVLIGILVVQVLVNSGQVRCWLMMGLSLLKKLVGGRLFQFLCYSDLCLVLQWLWCRFCGCVVLESRVGIQL